MNGRRPSRRRERPVPASDAPPGPPRASPTRAPELPAPPDLRLVPAALASWGVAIAALTVGWGVALVLVALAVVAVVIAARRSRAGGVRAVVVAACGCAAAVGLVAGLGAFAVADHPLRPATGNGVSARLDLVLTTDPRPIRSTVPGPGRVVVRGELVGGQVGAGPGWRAGGRVVLIAPADEWGGLLPGQLVTARGRLAPPDRADLTVAVLQVRGPPRAVGPVPALQRAAGDLRGGLRDAARAVLAEDPAGLLPGLVVGDTSGVSPGLDDDFRTAGLAHLTAVSGTNVRHVVSTRGAAAKSWMLVLRLTRLTAWRQDAHRHQAVATRGEGAWSVGRSAGVALAPDRAVPIRTRSGR